jgi:hypothetical protein
MPGTTTIDEFEPIVPQIEAFIRDESQYESLLSSVLKGPGNPDRRRWKWLRIALLRELPRHKIAVNKNADGKAARIFACVLEEADRLDGRPSKPRAAFNGRQWAIWVEQANRVTLERDRDALAGLKRLREALERDPDVLAGRKRFGVNGGSVKVWMVSVPRDKKPQGGKSRQNS